MAYRIERFFPVPDICTGEGTEFGEGEVIATMNTSVEAWERWSKGADDAGMYCLYDYDNNGHFMLACGIID